MDRWIDGWIDGWTWMRSSDSEDPFGSLRLSHACSGDCSLKPNFSSQVDYDKNFLFYMTTKMPNPHYFPEVCIKARRTCLCFFVSFTQNSPGIKQLGAKNKTKQACCSAMSEAVPVDRQTMLYRWMMREDIKCSLVHRIFWGGGLKFYLQVQNHRLIRTAQLASYIIMWCIAQWHMRCHCLLG